LKREKKTAMSGTVSTTTVILIVFIVLLALFLGWCVYKYWKQSAVKETETQRLGGSEIENTTLAATQAVIPAAVTTTEGGMASSESQPASSSDPAAYSHLERTSVTNM
jgi:cytoskeletal protein RodZ